MEQFDSSVEESSKVSKQQQRNDEQQFPSCAAELTEAAWHNKASQRVTYSGNAQFCHGDSTSDVIMVGVTWYGN